MKKGPQYQKRSLRKCVVALRGTNEVFAIKNYRKWLKNGNKEDVIVFEDCDEDRLEEKYLYWERTINYKKYAID